MLSYTKKALEEFDNQHDFERMGADILNGLGYKDVVLVAPKGGKDGGRDVTFTTESRGKGLACVSLRKDVDKKFAEDFHQRRKGEFEKYYFFTNQYLTHDQKKNYIRYCLDELDAELIPQDIEALRSLLDSSFTRTRRKYLHIDDDKSVKIKKEITNFLLFPKALPQSNHKDRTGYTEWQLTQPVHREIFYYTTEFDTKELQELPDIGMLLLNYQKHYYIYKEYTDELTQKAREIIATQSETSFQYTNGWTIYYDYFLCRVTGHSIEEAQKQISLNYSITFGQCERVFNLIRNQQVINDIVDKLNDSWKEVVKYLRQIEEALLKK